MKRLVPLLLALPLLLVACNEDPPTQRLPDTGGTVDTGTFSDTRSDSGVDTDPDTGLMVECTSGEDCASGICGPEGRCADPTCTDGVQNRDETDVDCGGDTCEACAETKACGEADDCQSGVCEDGQCAAPDCEDGVQNGEETDVDCGGGCAGCDNQQGCGEAGDCKSGVCQTDGEGDSGVCVAATCMDGAKNGQETDVDCGGADSGCVACEAMEACSEADDCKSGVCEDGTCQAPACDDGVKNGSETGTDCGGMEAGSACVPCSAGEGCRADIDCKSNLCRMDSNTGGTCEAATCDDMIKNGSETDIDCGGMNCEACGPGQVCGSKTDCKSGVCRGGACAGAACDDGVKNGDETAVDCGGTSCNACPSGQACGQDSDCASRICDQGTCVAPSCMDMVKNAGESDVDCGGPACAACMVGQSCDDGGDCVSLVCDGGKCAAPTCNDKAKNGQETDVDCGGAGSGCTGCAAGGACNTGGDCKTGVCAGGTCQMATCSDGVTNGGETDTDCGGPCQTACQPGDSCGVAADCTSGVCSGGVCQQPSCSDKTKNGTETDVDCGGPKCSGCQVGASCKKDGDCASNVCQGGTCITCKNGDTRTTQRGCGYQSRGRVTQTCQNQSWSDTGCTGVWYSSCRDLLNAKPGSSDGVYTLDPGGSGGEAPFKAYCDMTTDGGGWTLVMKTDGRKPTFKYSSKLWTNKKTHNASAAGYDHKEAKLASFHRVGFSEIKIGLEHPIGQGAPSPKTATFNLGQTASLHAVFSPGKYIATSFGKGNWLGLIGGSVLQQNCNKEGFNLKAGSLPHSQVRIGFIANNETSCGSSDSFIGIGTEGLTDTSCGGPYQAVYTGNLAQGGCVTNGGGTSEKQAFGVIFVR